MSAMPKPIVATLPQSSSSSRRLDQLWLTVLGATAAGGASYGRICAVVDSAPDQWRPSAWLLAEALDEMTRGGHLLPRIEDGELVYSLGARGRETLCLLLSVLAPPLALTAEWHNGAGRMDPFATGTAANA